MPSVMLMGAYQKPAKKSPVPKKGGEKGNFDTQVGELDDEMKEPTPAMRIKNMAKEEKHHATRRWVSGELSTAAIFLFLNGFILLGGEKIKNVGHKTLSELDWKAALLIGSCQALALIPGISRSGVTMAGGLLAGLKHGEAARFSFLLATPIIAGAGVLEVPKMIASTANLGTLSVVAGLVAGVVAYGSTVVLMRYFKTHEISAMMPFSIYCWLIGALGIMLLH